MYSQKINNSKIPKCNYRNICIHLLLPWCLEWNNSSDGYFQWRMAVKSSPVITWGFYMNYRDYFFMLRRKAKQTFVIIWIKHTILYDVWWCIPVVWYIYAFIFSIFHHFSLVSFLSTKKDNFYQEPYSRVCGMRSALSCGIQFICERGKNIRLIKIFCEFYGIPYI